MRNKLIDIIDSFRELDPPHDGRTWTEHLADHLLAEGVIMPPCKVGDTVYVIIDMDNPARRMLECKVISISVEEASIYFQFQTFIKYLYRYGSFNIDDIGKTVFLTREEAEKAVGRSENGKS